MVDIQRSCPNLPASLPAGQAVGSLTAEKWIGRHGQDCAGIGVHDDDRAAVGDVIDADRVSQFFLGDFLDIDVDVEHDVLAVLGPQAGRHRKRQLALAAVIVGFDIGIARLAGQERVILQLDPQLPDQLSFAEAGIADDLAGQRAVGVIAARFGVDPDAAQIVSSLI